MRGRFTAESVDDLRRNRWTVCPGIGGRFPPESVVDLGRNTHRKAPVTLRELIAELNPVIRGWGTYFRKAHVRGLFNRLDRWIERRLYSFLAKRWRNGMWRRYPTRRLIEEFGLVRLIQLIPGLVVR